MCEPRNRDNGASDVWALTAYTDNETNVSVFTNSFHVNHFTSNVDLIQAQVHDAQ